MYLSDRVAGLRFRLAWGAEKSTLLFMCACAGGVQVLTGVSFVNFSGVELFTGTGDFSVMGGECTGRAAPQTSCHTDDRCSRSTVKGPVTYNSRRALVL
jgi:hypothetical protein